MPKDTQLSRLQSFGASYDPALPKVVYGAHLVEHIFKFKEVSYSEILSWAQLTGTPLTAWEAETMYQIRCSYDAMKEAAVDRDMLAPYLPDEHVAHTVNAQFDRLWSVAE